MPVSPINTIAEVMKHPQVLARDMLVEIDHPVAGTITVPGIPVKLSETPGALRSAAPTLGEHTEALLSELLGYTPNRLPSCTRRARSDGAVFTVACAQFAVTPLAVRENVEKALTWTEHAADETGARLVVLPESVTTGFTRLSGRRALVAGRRSARPTHGARGRPSTRAQPVPRLSDLRTRTTTGHYLQQRRVVRARRGSWASTERRTLFPLSAGAPGDGPHLAQNRWWSRRR